MQKACFLQLKTVYATSHDILLQMSGIQLQTLKEKKSLFYFLIQFWENYISAFQTNNGAK